MRIREKGSSAPSGPGRDTGRLERARTFRATHSVGQHVLGRFMQREPDGLAWVSFDGLPMLASIEGTPARNALLHFVVQSLTPDIVLKEVPPDGKNGSSGASLMRDFDTVRSAFENAARDVLLAPMPKDLTISKRRDAMLGALSEEQLKLYLETTAAQGHINTRLAASGSARLLYLPWLVEGALRQDLIVRTDVKEDGTVYTELSFGFSAQSTGPGLIRILSRRTPENEQRLTSLRFFPERQDVLPVARAVLRALDQRLGENTSLLGAERPLRYQHGGVLSELLAPDPHKLHGLGS